MDESKVMNTLVRDFLGLLALALTVFALVALATYSPSDPSFSHKFSEKAVAVNSGGMIGAYLSDGLAQVFGSGAFFFPLVTVALGWALIRGREVRAWPLVLGPGIFLLIGVCALVGILSHTDPFFKAGVPPGGMIGTLLGHFMLKWLSTVGAILVLSALILFCVIAMTGITVNMLIEAIGKGAQWGIEQVKALALRIRSRIEERIKRLEERKTETKKAARKKAEPVIVTRQPVFPVAPAVPVAPDRASPPKPEKKARPEPGDFVVQQDFDFITELGDYRVPPLSLLDDPPPHGGHERAREEILASSAILEKKLADFGIEGKVVQVLPGPLITLFEFEPAPGIKVSRILSLTDDLALALRAMSLRILAPVPGKPVVGIEVPNLKRETIYFKDIISSETFAHSKSKLSMVIGKDTVGEPVVEDLATVPHLLIAGSTGSGKSVGLNAMICSILLNASPDEVKFIMVDPKMLELSIYDGIPHLISPVVTNPKKAAAALQWAVKEMENRYKLMAEKGVRNIGGYNHAIDKLHRHYEEEKKKREKAKKLVRVKPGDEEAHEEEEDALIPPPPKLPYIVVVIDELADLMMVASKGVEDALIRLAQMARASGIHLILATQRPSVDVLTGIIKANFPSRISYKVTSRVDSRTILDAMGAEKLLGRGDLLFLPPGTNRVQRIHGAMVSDVEIHRIVDFIKKQKQPEYSEDIFDCVVEDNVPAEADEEYDEKYDEAVALVARERQASISYIQRRLRIGYNRAARIIEMMEKDGVIGPSDGVKPREVFVTPIALENDL